MSPATYATPIAVPAIAIAGTDSTTATIAAATSFFHVGAK